MPIPKLYRQPKFVLLLLVLLFGVLVAGCWYVYQRQLKNLEKQLYELQHQLQTQRCMNSKLLLFTLLLSIFSYGLLAQVTPQGSLSGNTICPGAQATLTFTATAGTGPFTVRYTDGNAIRTQTGVTSGTPFNAMSKTTATKTYTLLKVTGADGGIRSGGFTDATGTVTVSARPDLKDLTLSPIAPVCAGSNASLSLSGFVQTRSFQTKPSISTSANSAQSVHAADLDGDGDLDVLSASESDKKIAWYQNDGSGNFSSENVISTLAMGALSVYAADLDGDGDLDVLSASFNDDKIAWYQNNGSGGFGAQQVISTADGAESVYAADLDGDGDLDVLSASSVDDKVAWYQNNGSGGFGAKQVIGTADGAVSVYAADLDGDGDLDVLSASFLDNKVAWYQNNGSGGFGAQRVISTAADAAVSVYAADLDGDGDLDVLSASYSDDEIAWYQNNGSGGFGAQQVISTAANGAIAVYATDLDGDGDLDVISASILDDKIAWYQNNGSGGFGAQQVISTSANDAQAVYAADLDGDGDIDVLSASAFDDKIAWYENRTPFSGNATVTYTAGGGVPKTVTVPVSAGSATVTLTAPKAGAVTVLKVANADGCAVGVSKSTPLRPLPRPDLKDLTLGPIAPVCTGSNATLPLSGFVQTHSFQTKTAISTSADEAWSVYAADLDGDGDIDVLSASSLDNKIAWYQNNGSGTFTAQPAISTEADGARSVYAADLDGDGDMDVLSASFNSHKIVWYQNDGSGTFTAQPAISTSAVGAFSVYAADLDGDGDMDVLSASLLGDKIVWYENNGSGTFTAKPAISTSADGVSSVYAADLDGDGDMDVLSASVNSNRVEWYQNNGSGGFTKQPAINTSADGAHSVYAADLDGDGDMDVMSASILDRKIAWYQNNGSGGFTEQPAISTEVYGARSVYAADLDGDGDVDALSASYLDNKIAWYKNNGSGTFTAQPVISTSAIAAQSVYAADLDGDGDLDVLSASTSDDKIAWYENRTPFNGNAQVSYTINGGSTQTAPITVSSGSASAVIVSPVSGTLQLSKISVPGGCETAVSSSVSLPVDPVSIGGTVSAPQTICTNTSPADLTLSGQVGNVVRWEKSVNPSFISPTPIFSLLTTLTSAVMGTLTADTYFRAVVKSGVCSEATSSSVLITVNLLPTASISGTTTVCRNSPSPTITFTGANATAPYTFTYKINDGAPQTVTTTSGNSATVAAPTGTAGTFVYSLISVSENSSAACSQTQTGSATVTVNPLPTASISSTTTVCQNSASPMITFMGATATAPYTFTYKINDGGPQTVKTTSGNSVTVAAPTGTAGVFEYSLISVSENSSAACSQTQTGSSTVTVNPLPTASISGTTTVCKNSASPTITFTGANATAPYTFIYKINDGAPQTVKTTSGNSATVAAPTGTAGTFVYSLISVSENSSAACSQEQMGSATVTVNPLPTATISGTTTVCQNSPSPNITFTGANATAPYTFTYKINDGAPQTVKTTSGNSVTVAVPTGTAGTFVYSLISVSESSSTACSQTQMGSATVTVNPLPTASISGTTTVCQNSISPNITFTGATATAPYTFTYKINDGAPQTVTTTSGNSVTVAAPTGTAGTFVYSLISVSENSSTACSQTQTGSATVTVNPLPTASISGTTTVCQNSTSPNITFTGANATAPYTFTYKINDGAPQTVKTTSGNSVTVSASTGTAGTFEYSLISVSESSTTVCSQTQTGSAAVTVNPLPTATISGTTTVCKNSASPTITFTGANATAPYTFIYKINDGAPQTVKTTSGNSVTVSASTGTAGAFEYSLISVSESSTTVCSQTQTGSATVTVNPLPTATISETTTVCKNSASPTITFTGAAATAPYTFTYKINDGAPQTVKTTSGNSVTVSAPTGTAGMFDYSLISVSESSSTACSQTQTGSATVTVQGKPTITLTALQQTLNEGNLQTLCDIDANPVNGLQFTVTGSCVVGNPVWRVQVGSGAWSEWSLSAPVSQLSNNQVHRYQAACDASCPVTYTSPIELTINYRASIPQNVSMIADGVSVNAGETKEVCNIEGNSISFNATCAWGEILLYSVDGGDYSSVIPTQLVDGQYHNYRVRCRKSDGTTSCVETESGVIRLRITTSLQAPSVSLNVTSGCGSPVAFSGTANCGAATTIWYHATSNVALPSLPNQTPTETTSYYARCQAGGGCLSEKSNVVTYTVIPVSQAPVVTTSADIVCTGTEVTVSVNCPAGTTPFWNTGVSESSFKVSFSSVTKQSYWVRCNHSNGCQSAESAKKEITWKAFVVTFINIGQSKSAVKVNDRAAWSSQFVTPDGGPELEQSTQTSPTLYYVENANKVAPRYWTINVDACGLGTNGSLTFDLLATPETGVPQSFNTHENNAPYFMYANREGWTELYAQNHPAYGFYQDNGVGGNVYDAGLPKGLYKLGIRYWDQKGWGSIYPSTRKPQGNVLAYQEYWFRIQSRSGVGVGAARAVANGEPSAVSGEQGEFATVLPNPVTNILRLKVQESKGQVVEATLVDVLGRPMLKREFVPLTNDHWEEVPTAGLEVGVYLLKVKVSNRQQFIKVIKASGE